jgi:hypothetical protein
MMKMFKIVDLSGLSEKQFGDLGRGPIIYDCWGYVIEVRNRYGLYTPDYGEIHYWEKEKIINYVNTPIDFYKISGNPEDGDIAVFKEMDNKFHFGVVIQTYYIIHIGPVMGVRKNRWDHPVFKQLIEGFYRWKISQ